MKNRKTIASILAAILAAIMLLSLIAGILPRPAEAASSSEIKKQLDAALNSGDTVYYTVITFDLDSFNA